MKISTEKLTAFFEDASSLRLIHRAASPPSNYTCKDDNLVGYLTHIRPYPLHIIGKYESEYLGTLPEQAQVALVKQLEAQHALSLIFETPYDIPKCFFQQSSMHLIQSNTPSTSLRQQLNNELNEHFSERTSQHGAFVVVHGQGILITGNSGAGKSSLLLSLIKLGHLWVADDMTLFYLDTNAQVIGHAEENLSEYMHIKGLGPINMDKTHGLACRIRSHPLAATIHLSDNTEQKNQNISAYTQRDTMTLLNKNFPQWHLASSSQNLPSLVESCAKNLILESWNCSPINELKNALNTVLLSNERKM